MFLKGRRILPRAKRDDQTYEKFKSETFLLMNKFVLYFEQFLQKLGLNLQIKLLGCDLYPFYPTHRLFNERKIHSLRVLF